MRCPESAVNARGSQTAGLVPVVCGFGCKREFESLVKRGAIVALDYGTVAAIVGRTDALNSPQCLRSSPLMIAIHPDHRHPIETI